MNDTHSKNMISCCCDCMEVKPIGYGYGVDHFMPVACFVFCRSILYWDVGL